MPEPFGMRMSITTTSGRFWRARRTASSPDPASPDHAEARLPVEQRGQADADHLVIVGDEDAHGGRASGQCDRSWAATCRCHRHRKREPRCRARARSPRSELRVEQLGATPDVGEALRSPSSPAVAVVGGIESGAVVAHLEREAALRAGHPHRHRGRVGVAQHVAEGLERDVAQLLGLLRGQPCAGTGPPAGCPASPACGPGAHRRPPARWPPRPAPRVPRTEGRRWCCGCLR